MENEKRKDAPRNKGRITTWFKEVRAEFTKIIWPNRKELFKMTITVIVTSLIFGVLITGFDAVFGFIVGLLVETFHI